MDYKNSSNKTWYIIGIVVVIALAFWYFLANSSSSTITGPSTAEQTQTPPTTASISSDLNQIPDDTATLNQAASASAATVNGF